MPKTLTPYMDIPAKSTKTAYKQGRSAIDILPTVQNPLKQNETQLRILIDLSGAFDSINRNILWGVLYEKDYAAKRPNNYEWGNRKQTTPKQKWGIW